MIHVGLRERRARLLVTATRPRDAQGRRHRHRGPARPAGRAPPAPRSRLARGRHRSARRSPAGPRTSSTTRSISAARRRATSSAPATSTRSSTSASCTTRARATAEHYSWNISGTDEAARVLRSRTECPRSCCCRPRTSTARAPDNPQFLTEDAPLLAAQRFPADARPRRDRHLVSLLLLEARARSRPSSCARSTSSGAVQQRAVELPAPPVVPDPARLRSDGADHPRARRRRGDRAARSRPARAASSTSSARARCRCRRSCASSASRPCPIPHPLAKPILARRLAARHLNSFPVAELDFIRYVCMVDATRASRSSDSAPAIRCARPSTRCSTPASDRTQPGRIANARGRERERQATPSRERLFTGRRSFKRTCRFVATSVMAAPRPAFSVPDGRVQPIPGLFCQRVIASGESPTGLRHLPARIRGNFRSS